MSKTRNERRGFTLVELLVVMSIIALLAGLFLPMLVKSLRAGRRARTGADINSIAMALEAYRADFGDYPRIPTDPATGLPIEGTGFAVLAKALVGPFGDGVLPGSVAADTNDPPAYDAGKQYHTGDCVNTNPTTFYIALVDNVGQATSNLLYWAPMNCRDGADGPGFRGRNDTVNNIKSKISGPYLSPEKFKMQGLAILDNNGFPILYYPTSPAKVNLAVSAGNTFYVNASSVSPGSTMMFNFDNNGTLSIAHSGDDTPSLAKSLARMQVMLGSVSNIGGVNQGKLAAGESPAFTGPFILWSLGSDGFFGPREDVTQWSADQGRIHKAVNDCDDVTNFTFAK